jgi:hypothetical protein
MNKLLERAIEEVATLPEDQQEVVAARMLDEVRRRTVRKGKWAEVADRLARLDLLRGRSAEFQHHVREFRDGFEFRAPPSP